MSAEDWMHWLDDPASAQQSRLHQAMLISLAAHLVVVAALSLAPQPEAFLLPPAISVDLLAALPTVEPAAKAVPAPPPPPKAKVKILPKKAPSATAAPRVEPKPIVRRERPKELSYDDAMAKLLKETGETAPAAPTQEVAQARIAPAQPNPRGARVSAELAAWTQKVKMHIRSKWITPPEFRESGLATMLEVNLAADGRVLGQPKLMRSSGNPYYDDNALRAILKSSPLPAPPEAGRRTIIFTPEG